MVDILKYLLSKFVNSTIRFHILSKKKYEVLLMKNMDHLNVLTRTVCKHMS